MERNGSTAGGDDSKFEDIMHEGGVSDEFTPIAEHTRQLRQLSDA